MGADHFFRFGLTVDEIDRPWREGCHPERLVEANADLSAVLALIADGTFSRGDRDLCRPIVDDLRFSDPFLLVADCSDNPACQDRVAAAWRDPPRWTRMSILNSARAGKFSSDRAITEYAGPIWKLPPVHRPRQ